MTPVDSWVQLFRALLSERSVFEHEHGAIAIIERRLSALRIPLARVEHSRKRLETLAHAVPPFSDVPDRVSLVARLPGAIGGRSLLFNTHLDIVPEGDHAAWSRPPFGGYIDEGARVIYGRGAMDDRAGVVIAVAVLETLSTASPLAGDVLFQFVLEDETTGNGTLLCLEDGHRADAAVIIDGTRPDRAITSHAGQQQFRVAARGRPASVSVSHLGVNAASLLVQFVLDLQNQFAALNEDRVEMWRVFPSPFQLVLQGLHCEVVTLTVPEHASATCYATFPPPFNLSGFRDWIEERKTAFNAANEAGSIQVDWEGFSAEPVSANLGPFGELLAAAAHGNGLGSIAFGPSTGTSDLRHLVRAGIPALLYGPGRGFNPHRPDEHFHLDDLAPMVRTFTELARNWCGLAAVAR